MERSTIFSGKTHCIFLWPCLIASCESLPAGISCLRRFSMLLPFSLTVIPSRIGPRLKLLRRFLVPWSQPCFKVPRSKLGYSECTGDMCHIHFSHIVNGCQWLMASSCNMEKEPHPGIQRCWCFSLNPDNLRQTLSSMPWSIKQDH